MSSKVIIVRLLPPEYSTESKILMNNNLEVAIKAAYDAGLEIIDVYGSSFSVELK